MEEKEKILISMKLLEGIANYLAKKPYGEVFQLINMLNFEVRQASAKQEDPINGEVPKEDRPE